MKDKLAKYVELLFAGSHASEDMVQEILQNTLDKYDDYIAQGKPEEAAYRLAISGIGDVSELLGEAEKVSPSPTPANTDYRGRPVKPMWKKVLTAIAVGLYILCAVPLIILSELGYDTLGVISAISIAAVATVAIIIASGGDSERKQEKQEQPEQKPLQKAAKTLIDVLGLCAYFVISFHTGAWYITWLIFPIMGAIQGIVTAIFDLFRRDEA